MMVSMKVTVIFDVAQYSLTDRKQKTEIKHQMQLTVFLKQGTIKHLVPTDQF